MNLYSFVIENKEILEAVYSLIIGLICAVIVSKTDKFFRLSLHQGIRYFRNSFLFFGLAFLARYIFGLSLGLSLTYAFVVQIAFEYFLVMAGFFLLYSLIWKKFESPKDKYFSSLFNTKVAIFHFMALLIAAGDSLWNDYNFMFISQIIIFSYASVLSCINYRNDAGKHQFPKFYFLAMLSGLCAWILNFLAEAYFEWNKWILINIGIINIIFFLLFLYGIIRVIKTK